MGRFGRRRWWLTGLAALAMGGAGAGDWLYEHRHLSAGMRHVLTAGVAADPGAGLDPAAVGRVIAGARLEVHTARDAEVYRELARALELRVAADFAEARLAESQRKTVLEENDELHSEQLLQVMQQAYLAGRMETQTSLGNDVPEELERRERLRDTEQRAVERDRLLCLEQRLESKALLQEIRTDLGR